MRVDPLAGALDLRGVAILLRDHEGRLVVRAASGIYRDAALATSLLLHVGEELPRDGQAHAGSGRWIALSARGEESGMIYLGPTMSAAELGDADCCWTSACRSSTALRWRGCSRPRFPRRASWS